MSADIKSNLEVVRDRIIAACRRVNRSANEVTLIAVTKTVDSQAVETAFKAGVRNFGENRLQEAEKKIHELSYLQPVPTWHMIGHLQSNKVKAALECFDIIHSVDSPELAEAINRRASRKVPIMLEVNVAGETAKSGLSPKQLFPAFESISRLSNIEIKGLMTVAPLVDDAERVRPVFRRLREMRDTLHLEHLSMGMTDDFEIAIEEGATMVRIGRAIFGERS